MKRAIVILLIVVAVAAAGLFVNRKLQAASPAEKTQYKIAKAEVGMVKKTVSATGTLQPWKVVDIKSKAGGKVLDMAVDVGSVVNAGDVICHIDPADTKLQVDQATADINSANASIKQSQIALSLQQAQSSLGIDQAQAALESAYSNLEAAKARRETAKSQMTAQPLLTEATINSAKANLNSLQRQLDQMQQAANPQDRASAQSTLDQAKANERNAKSNLTRQKNLLEKGFVSQAVVDQAQAAEEVAQAQVSSAQRKLDTIEQEQTADVESLKARIEQAKAQLANAEAARVDVELRKSAYREAEASVRQLEHQIENSKVALRLANANEQSVPMKAEDIASAVARKAKARAAFINADKTWREATVEAPVIDATKKQHGPYVVLKKYVEAGTMISSALSFAATGNNIVQLGDITRMYVDVTVDETDIANVDDGQAVDVTMEAYPTASFEGKVIRIDPQTEVVQNVTMVHVRVEIDNSDQTFRLLKPGMNATCEFVIDKKDDVVSVPAEAVRTDDKGRYVEFAKGGTPYKAPDATEADPTTLTDVRVVHQPVEIGLEGNDAVEVKSGVKEGDVLITQKIEPTPKTASSPFAQQRMGGFRSGTSGGGGGGGGARR